MFAGSSSQVRSISAGAFNMDTVDDVEKSLHNGNFLVHKLNFSIYRLKQNGLHLSVCFKF